MIVVMVNTKYTDGKPDLYVTARRNKSPCSRGGFAQVCQKWYMTTVCGALTKDQGEIRKCAHKFAEKSKIMDEHGVCK